MASEKKDTGELLKDQNVFVRILNLRSVSDALETIEKTYISTKQSHPIISSVCGLYEKGVCTAGSLAVWSMKPALNVLEPQLVAANSMACRGLDQLEEKVPALQSPPAELAANIKELMSSTLESAKDGLTSPIKHTSNVVLDKVSTRYQRSKTALSGGIDYILNSKLVCLAEQRAVRALSLTENLVDYVLPASSTETEDDGSMGKLEPDADVSGPKPMFSRLRGLAGTVSSRAFEKTAAQLQHSKRQGQTLVTQIPGVSPLVDYTVRTVKTVGGVILGLPSSVASFLNDGQQHSPLSEMTNAEHDQLERNVVSRLVSGLGQRLLNVYGSVVANVKNTRQTSLDMAKDGVNIVMDSFGTVRERALDITAYYRLNKDNKTDSDEKAPDHRDTPKQNSKPEGGSQPAEKDGAEESLHGSLVLVSSVEDLIQSPSDNSENQLPKLTEPKEIEEETLQLKKKVMTQIPVQQNIVPGGSNKKMANPRASRKTLTDHTQISSPSSPSSPPSSSSSPPPSSSSSTPPSSSSSSYTCTVQNSRNTAPTAE